jgi:hypothetical protein
MVHCMHAKVKLLDLLMSQSPCDQEGNQMIFEDGASKCQFK